MLDQSFVVEADAVDDNNKAMVKIADLIERGRRSAGAVIEKVQTEVPTDHMVTMHAMRFIGHQDQVRTVFDGEEYRMHKHAFKQLGEVLDMTWMPEMIRRKSTNDEGTIDPWGSRIVADALNVASHYTHTRHLVRSVGDQIRGIVSDKFRRIDARPILDAALGAFESVGLQPYEGNWMETRLELKAIVPKLYAPIPGELIAFGLSLRTSDYGDGAFDIRAFMLRPVCANGMISDSALRAVHVGKRLSDDMQLSERTMKLDTKAMASATRDVVEHALSQGVIRERLLGMAKAAATEVDPIKASIALRKYLTKADTDRVIAHFETPDVVTLPKGNSVLRMANAVSWLANKTEDPRRAIELQEIAGKLMS